jgi:Fur family ferric uptake transcriptional regulator
MGQRTETVAAARERLAAHDIRFTTARRLVVETLATSPGPQSAADLIKGIGGRIPLSSLYRTLSVLEELGVIERFPDQDGIARFELAEWLAGHHHHVTCIVCGDTSDVPVPEDLESAVTEIVTEVGRRFEFRVTGHRLDLQGVCSRCR